MMRDLLFPGKNNDSWAVRQRQEWIGEMAHIYGFINREHIQRKFEVSTPQASADIQRFIDANPNVLAYNKSTKRYEAVSDSSGDRG